MADHILYRACRHARLVDNAPAYESAMIRVNRSVEKMEERGYLLSENFAANSVVSCWDCGKLFVCREGILGDHEWKPLRWYHLKAKRGLRKADGK